MAEYDPKIYIRGYGAPTARDLIYSTACLVGVGSFGDIESLIDRVENPFDAGTEIRLSGDAQTADDSLSLSGDMAPGELRLANPISTIVAAHDIQERVNEETDSVASVSTTVTVNAVGELIGEVDHVEVAETTVSLSAVTEIEELIDSMPTVGTAVTLNTVSESLGVIDAIPTTGTTVTANDVRLEEHLIDVIDTKSFAVTTRPINEIAGFIDSIPVSAATVTVGTVGEVFFASSESGIILSGDAKDTPNDGIEFSGDAGPGLIIAAPESDTSVETVATTVTANDVLISETDKVQTATITVTANDVLLQETDVFTPVSTVVTVNTVLEYWLDSIPTTGVITTANDVAEDITNIDKIILSGDAADVAGDALSLSGDQIGVLLHGYNSFVDTVSVVSVTVTANDVATPEMSPVALSGDAQSGGDELMLSGDETGSLMTVTE